MTRNDGLLLATVVLALYGVGNVWPVQVSSYPLWAYVGPRSSTPTTWRGGEASGE